VQHLTCTQELIVRGVKFTTRLHPVPRLGISGPTPLFPVYALEAWIRASLPFFFTVDSSRYASLGSATGWTVRGSNPGGGEVFPTRPERPWGSHSLLYGGYKVSFSAAWSWHWPLTPRLAPRLKKESRYIYLYYPSRPSCPVVGWTLFCTLTRTVLRDDSAAFAAIPICREAGRNRFRLLCRG